LNDSGIGAAVYFKIPVHKTPLYERLGFGKKVLKATEESSKHVISIPVHPGVTEPEMEKVADLFKKACIANM